MVPTVHIALSYGQVALAIVAIALIAGVLARMFLYWRWQELVTAEKYVLECDRRNRELFAWIIDAVEDPAVVAAVPRELLAVRAPEHTRPTGAQIMSGISSVWLRYPRRIGAGKHRADRLAVAR